MKKEVKEIPFNGSKLFGVRTPDGNVWLAVKKACLDIGLNENQARTEIKKIQESLLFQNENKKLSVKFDTQVRETLFLAEKFVPMWLAQINLTPAMQKRNPDAVKKLLKYQLEAADVLHKAFYETEEQKAKLSEELGLHGEIVELKQEVKVLTESVNTLIDNSTVNMTQQKALYNAAKERICFLLDGKKSEAYKKCAKLYFQNLWGDVKRSFHCSGSYHDLNPKDYHSVLEYITRWDYTY